MGPRRRILLACFLLLALLASSKQVLDVRNLQIRGYGSSSSPPSPHHDAASTGLLGDIVRQGQSRPRPPPTGLLQDIVHHAHATPPSPPHDVHSTLVHPAQHGRPVQSVHPMHQWHSVQPAHPMHPTHSDHTTHPHTAPTTASDGYPKHYQKFERVGHLAASLAPGKRPLKRPPKGTPRSTEPWWKQAGKGPRRQDGTSPTFAQQQEYRRRKKLYESKMQQSSANSSGHSQHPPQGGHGQGRPGSPGAGSRAFSKRSLDQHPAPRGFDSSGLLGDIVKEGHKKSTPSHSTDTTGHTAHQAHPGHVLHGHPVQPFHSAHPHPAHPAQASQMTHGHPAHPSQVGHDHTSHVTHATQTVKVHPTYVVPSTHSTHPPPSHPGHATPAPKRKQPSGMAQLGASLRPGTSVPKPRNKKPQGPVGHKPEGPWWKQSGRAPRRQDGTNPRYEYGKEYRAMRKKLKQEQQAKPADHHPSGHQQHHPPGSPGAGTHAVAKRDDEGALVSRGSGSRSPSPHNADHSTGLLGDVVRQAQRRPVHQPTGLLDDIVHAHARPAAHPSHQQATQTHPMHSSHPSQTVQAHPQAHHPAQFGHPSHLMHTSQTTYAHPPAHQAHPAHQAQVGHPGQANYAHDQAHHLYSTQHLNTHPQMHPTQHLNAHPQMHPNHLQAHPAHATFPKLASQSVSAKPKPRPPRKPKPKAPQKEPERLQNMGQLGGSLRAGPSQMKKPGDKTPQGPSDSKAKGPWWKQAGKGPRRQAGESPLFAQQKQYRTERKYLEQIMKGHHPDEHPSGHQQQHDHPPGSPGAGSHAVAKRNVKRALVSRGSGSRSSSPHDDRPPNHQGMPLHPMHPSQTMRTHPQSHQSPHYGHSNHPMHTVDTTLTLGPTHRRHSVQPSNVPGHGHPIHSQAHPTHPQAHQTRPTAHTAYPTFPKLAKLGGQFTSGKLKAQPKDQETKPEPRLKLEHLAEALRVGPSQIKKPRDKTSKGPIGNKPKEAWWKQAGRGPNRQGGESPRYTYQKLYRNEKQKEQQKKQGHYPDQHPSAHFPKGGHRPGSPGAGGAGQTLAKRHFHNVLVARGSPSGSRSPSPHNQAHTMGLPAQPTAQGTQTCAAPLHSHLHSQTTQTTMHAAHPSHTTEVHPAHQTGTHATQMRPSHTIRGGAASRSRTDPKQKGLKSLGRIAASLRPGTGPSATKEKVPWWKQKGGVPQRVYGESPDFARARLYRERKKLRKELKALIDGPPEHPKSPPKKGDGPGSPGAAGASQAVSKRSDLLR